MVRPIMAQPYQAHLYIYWYSGHRLTRNCARYLYCYCAWVLDRRVETMPHGGCRDACARTEQSLR
jgi:hypothetical protein